MIEDITMILMVVAISAILAMLLYNQADLMSDFMKKEYGGTLDNIKQITGENDGCVK